MAERKKRVKKTHLACPYCDAEIIKADFPFCQACKVKVFHCWSCKMPIKREDTKCPHCGAEIKVNI